MTEATQQEGVKTALTRDEQTAKLMPALRQMMPSIMGMGKLYHETYPADKTPREVVAAVTVAVPLNIFMVMAGVCTNLTAAIIEKEQSEMKAKVDIGSGDAHA